MSIDFNDIYYFYLTAENGGYTAAERASGITKSLLSRRVSQLEDKIGVQLIRRNSRQFSLTEAGRQLFEGAINMVAEGQSAYDSVALLRSVPSGIVRVTCPTVLAQYHISKLLPDFMRQYPKISVSLDATDRDVQVIEERVDIALRSKKTLDSEPGLSTRPLANSKMVLVASPEFLATHGTPSHPSQLSRVPTLSEELDRLEGEHKWELFGPDNSSCTVRHHPRLFCLNRWIQLESAVQGIGVGLVPHAVAIPSIEKGLLVQVLPNWTSKAHIIHAVFSKRKGMNPAARVFLDYLILHLPEILNIPAYP